jgi:nucleoside-triphosphatase THEP1
MPASHDPVQRAFQSAVRDFKAGLKNEELYDKITSTQSIDEVYDYTDKLQEEQSRTGSLRHLSRLKPYLTRLSQYVAVMNNFGLTQMTPSVTSVLCGPILLLLQWASVLKQSLDAVVEITARIGELLPEFTEVAKLFHDNTCLQEVLVLFFRDILDFYSAALSFFGQSRLRPGSTGKVNTGFRAIFEALWPRHRSKIEQVATHIERHTSLMRNEVRLADIREEHGARIRAWEHFERTEMDHQRQEYKGIKTDINPPSYEKRFAHFRLRICKGTGDWLLNDKVFMQWFDSGDTTVKTLWLTGIPGAGKSFLATTIVDAALTRKTSTAGFAFLDYKQSSALSALSVIHSLIFQMASRSDDMEAIVCQSDVAAVKSQIEIATALLKTVLDCAGPSHIVIDGLDEIDGIERTVLIKQLLHLSAECSELKVVFSSRGEADIARVLRDNKVTIIEAHRRNTESIEVFVDARRDDWFRERQFWPEMQEELTRLLNPLAAKAGGMVKCFQQ